MNLVEEALKAYSELPEIKYTAKDFSSDQDVRWCQIGRAHV